ncbi:response regulator transcription factor [uncultured Cellulomonas sp.]|uniref:response regulator n=1 Tax=uncultured Cellulomonas sp. TaxID=189682 RepID=UPI0026175C16|nr:response regulator transcription factor [uncultured Cellulomonas sp.]
MDTSDADRTPVDRLEPGSSEATPRTSVFLLDDHEVVREGLIRLIDSQPDLVVVGEARTAREALVRAPGLQVDVAVLDVRLPDGDGVEVCRELRSQRPELACLMLTSFSDDEALLAAITAGAAGYVLKDIRGSDLVESIRAVAAGRTLLDAGSRARVLERLRVAQHQDERLDLLSAQERAILDLIGEGLTNRQIAQRMFLAEKTVKNYVSSLLAKIGVHGRTQAALFIAEERRAHPPGH